MNLENAVLATLFYSDIFDYPLTLPEIHSNLIFRKTKKSQVKKALVKLLKKRKIFKYRNLYQLKKPENLARLRILRGKIAQNKFKKANFAAKIISAIPTVKLIGISGALATKNATKNDDIDFFIICNKNSLFTTRFFCTIFLDLLKLRRKPKDLKFADKICLNMFLAENNLEISPQDLYLAHEILQMKPIFEKDFTYQKFLLANSWVFKFLPNWEVNTRRQTTNAKRSRLESLVVKLLALGVENALKRFQLKYMERRRTREIISDTKLFFHPEDVHKRVLEEFTDKLRQLKILL